MIKARKINIQIRINISEHFTEKQILNKSNSIIQHLNEKDYNLSLELQKLLNQDFLVFPVQDPETAFFFLLIIFYFSILFHNWFFHIAISLHLWAYLRFVCSIFYPHQLLYLLIIQLKLHLLNLRLQYRAKVTWTNRHQIFHHELKKQQLVFSKEFFSQDFLKSNEKSGFVYKVKKKSIPLQV